MLKKLSIAGLAFIASAGIAFADASDSMPASDTNAVSDSSTSSTSAASMNNAANDNTAVHKKHKKKHHHKKCHRRHHHKPVATNAVAPASDQDPVASSAPRADYKGEVPCTPTSCAHNSFMPGPYLGFSLGSRVNYTTSRRSPVYNGLEGTLLGGYGMLWDQWYGALEIFVQDSAEITNSVTTLSSAKSSWGYGLSILPGYMLVDNVLGYLRLGVVRTRFSTGNNNLTGGQVGLGMQAALCNNWDLRGEYIYSFYNALSNNGGNPKSQQFNLGLLYKFQM